MKKAKIIVISFLSLLLISFKSNAQILNVSEIFQEQDQWCWAGASACILDYYCHTTPQCEIAEYTRNVATWHNFGTTNCCVNPNLGCNYANYNWGYSGSIQDILDHFGDLSNYGVADSLTKSSVATNLQFNRLFVINWAWSTSGGHFIVGHGLSGNNMYYMDPWFGEGLKIASYDWVRSDGNHTWTHTNQLTTNYPSSPPDTATAIAGSAIVCQGQTNVYYAVSAIANADYYIWELPDGTIDTTTSNSIAVNYSTSSTNSSISVRGLNNCSDGYPSTKNITVNPKPPTPTITFNSNILHSDASVGNQWYNQNGIINGANSQDYTPIISGNYYCIVSLTGCDSDNSNTINVNISSVLEEENIIKIYPNPFSEKITFEKINIPFPIEYEIYSRLGQLEMTGFLDNNRTIYCEQLKDGVYYIILRNKNNFGIQKIIKITN